MDLSNLAIAGTTIAVRVTPKAAANRLTFEEGDIRAYVTVVPEDGKATAAVVKLLARALGIAPSKLSLIKGLTARDKVFRIDS